MGTHCVPLKLFRSVPQRIISPYKYTNTQVDLLGNTCAFDYNVYDLKGNGYTFNGDNSVYIVLPPFLGVTFKNRHLFRNLQESK